MKQAGTVLVVCAALLLALAPKAEAGSFAVLACDAAPGGASGSWAAQSGSVNAFKLCPTAGNTSLGMGTRMTGRTFAAGEYSRLMFLAPSGTTISGLYFGGRFRRDNCSWATELRARGAQDRILVGVPAQPGGCSAFEGQTGSVDFYAAPAGTTQLLQNTQCGAGSCPSGATFHTFYAGVVVSDPSLPAVSVTAGGLFSGRWVRRSATVSYSASDNVGIRDAAVTVAGRAGGVQRPGCNYTLAKPGGNAAGSLGFSTDQLGDGLYPVRLTASDCAGNVTRREATAKIDNTPPARVSPAVVGGDGWRQSNRFSLRWANHPDAYAPIVRARYELCRVGGSCSSGTRDGAGISELPITVSQPGDHRVRVSVEDEAGNVAPISDAAALRFDPDPPSLYFEPADPSDPLRVSVHATDAISGVAGGEIELRLRGGQTWHELQTSLQGRELSAYVDDERFRDGSYEFRARAFDRAGNERSTDRRATGARATLNLPVRYSTRLRVGIRRSRVRRTAVRRHGKRHLVRRKRVRYLGRGRVGLGRRIKLRGILTNRDGQPIDGATIDVYSRARHGARPFALVGNAHTDLRGRFSYIARASASRVLRFRYRGTRRIRSATREFTLMVPASATIHSDRHDVANGSSVVFSGRLHGGSIPSTGKLVLLQAVVRGSWRTFATPRTDRRGSWRLPYRFGATQGLVRYRFRLCVPSEVGYAFDSGCSRVITVRVRGP